MNHFAFIAASYGISAFVIAALALWIAVTQRTRKAELAALEQAGIKRRSDAT
jgi:heme exporter protein D